MSEVKFPRETFNVPLKARKAVAEANKKRIWSKESKAKLSSSLIGKNVGKIRSEETRKKISEARKRIETKRRKGK